jgi:hypothetical protein
MRLLLSSSWSSSICLSLSSSSLLMVLEFELMDIMAMEVAVDEELAIVALFEAMSSSSLEAAPTGANLFPEGG